MRRRVGLVLILSLLFLGVLVEIRLSATSAEQYPDLTENEVERLRTLDPELRSNLQELDRLNTLWLRVRDPMAYRRNQEVRAAWVLRAKETLSSPP